MNPYDETMIEPKTRAMVAAFLRRQGQKVAAESLEKATDAEIVEVPPTLWEVVSEAHAWKEGGSRFYHPIWHVVDVLARYDEVTRSVGWDDPAAVKHAILFHDAVYEVPTKHDADYAAGENERRSAELAVVHAPTPKVGARAAELILLTARHGSFRPGDLDHDAAHFLDCDMSILGAPPDAFREYDRGIAEEYLWLGEPPGFFAARRAFFEKLEEVRP